MKSFYVVSQALLKIFFCFSAFIITLLIGEEMNDVGRSVDSMEGIKILNNNYGRDRK